MTKEAQEHTLLATLPQHPVSDVDSAEHLLRVCGEVEAAADYRLTELLRWSTAVQTEDFTCLEGWVVSDQRWEGVPLGSLIERARPKRGATHVLLGAKDFTLVLTLERAREGMLALTLNGGRLPVVHGGPMRFFLPGGECYTSIKWLDRAELLREPVDGTARDIARRRIGLAPD